MEHTRYEFDAKLSGIGYKVSLVFRDNKAVIVGDSATDKSFLYQLIDTKANYYGFDAVCYNHACMTKLREDLKTGHFTYVNKLVVFDNAEVLLEEFESLAEEINLNCSNNYLLFARNAPGVDISPGLVGTLQYTNGTYSIKYKYKEGMWA